jgi:uncharacterized protein YjiS (DUF1127 family)
MRIKYGWLAGFPLAIQSIRLTYCAMQYSSWRFAMLTLLLAALRSLKAHLADWRARQRAYDELASLDDRSLADIGLTRADIPFVVSQRHPGALAATGTSRTASGNLRHAA